MFVRHEVSVDLSFDVARTRLANLLRGDSLAAASQDAYADGLVGTIRVGPLGDLPGASKLVRVSLLEPVHRDDVVVVPLRWEATGLTGKLFPILDADLTITAAPAGGTTMTLNGAYRPPLAAVGAGLDRLVLHHVATTTIRSLLNRVADAVASPAPAAEQWSSPLAGQRSWLIIDPETS